MGTISKRHSYNPTDFRAVKRQLGDCYKSTVTSDYFVRLELKRVDVYAWINVWLFQNDDIGGKYLVKTQSISLSLDGGMNEEQNAFEEDLQLSFETPVNHCHNEQLIKFEYHVLYHISYAVPYLCFNAYKSSMFTSPYSFRVQRCIAIAFILFFHFLQDGSYLTHDEAWRIFSDSSPRDAIKQNMLNILTQMEHPMLFRPFLTLHPCRIAEVLHALPQSQNKVLSFISTYGPSIHLTLDLKYANQLQQFDINKNHPDWNKRRFNAQKIHVAKCAAFYQ